jgi:hypothetical protein
MTHPIFHAQSSVRRFGGKVEDYGAIHDWLDVIWTVRQVKSGLNCSAANGRASWLLGFLDLQQRESGAEGTRISGSTEGTSLEGL